MAMETGKADYDRLPDYTDPNDVTRLRRVHRDSPAHRWGQDDDRDSADATRMRGLFTTMDVAHRAFIHATDPETALALAYDMAECWHQIRAIVGGGK